MIKGNMKYKYDKLFKHKAYGFIQHYVQRIKKTCYSLPNINMQSNVKEFHGT